LCTTSMRQDFFNINRPYPTYVSPQSTTQSPMICLQNKSNNTSDGSNGKSTDLVGASATDRGVSLGRLDGASAVDGSERVAVAGACRDDGLEWRRSCTCRLGAAGVQNGGGGNDGLDDCAWAVGDGDCGFLGQGIGVGLTIVGNGAAHWADGGIDIDNLSGIDDGIIAPSRNRARGQSQNSQ